MTAAPGASSGPPNLLALKILVVVMGIAIVAGVIVIVVAVSNRLSETGATAAPSGAGTAPEIRPEAGAVAIGDLSIAIPEGCVIAEANAEGKHLVLRLDGLAERGCQQVILIDLADGTVLGRVTAEPSQ